MGSHAYRYASFPLPLPSIHQQPPPLPPTGAFPYFLLSVPCRANERNFLPFSLSQNTTLNQAYLTYDNEKAIDAFWKSFLFFVLYTKFHDSFCGKSHLFALSSSSLLSSLVKKAMHSITSHLLSITPPHTYNPPNIAFYSCFHPIKTPLLHISTTTTEINGKFSPLYNFISLPFSLFYSLYKSCIYRTFCCNNYSTPPRLLWLLQQSITWIILLLIIDVTFCCIFYCCTVKKMAAAVFWTLVAMEGK